MKSKKIATLALVCEHRMGEMLAYILTLHEDTAVVKPIQLLAPFGIIHFYTEGWGAYLRLLEQQHHTVAR